MSASVTCKVFARTFLCAFVPALVFSICDNLSLFTSKKWNLLGYVMVMMADPWGTFWSQQGIAMGELLGFSLRDAMTVVLLPLFLAANLAIVVSVVAWIWRMIRRA
jgi:hypothetical protein